MSNGGGTASLVAPGVVSADAADVIEFEIGGVPSPGGPELTWQIEGEACADCILRLRPRDAGGPDRTLYRFEVGAHAGWRGSIRELTLRPTTLRNSEVAVRGVAILARRPLEGDRGSASMDEVVLFDANRESRPSRLLAPGKTISLALDPGDRDLLQFDLGRQGASREPAEVKVCVRVSQMCAISLVATAPAESGWYPSTIDLEGLDGSPASVEFTSTAVSSARPGEWPFLASPQLVGRSPSVPGPNVVLISLDTVRASRLSLYGNPRPTSPQLESLARKGGAVFERAVAAAASTLPAHASMFTGQEVLRHGAYLDLPLSAAAQTLAEKFAQGGYVTLATTGGGYVHPHFGLAQGFDRFRFWPRGNGEDGAEMRSGLDTAVAWIEEHRDRSFFLFFHTYEAHAPYRAHEPYFSNWTGESTSRFIQPWDRELHEEDGFFLRNRWPRVFGDGPARDLEPAELELLGKFYDSGVAAADSAVGKLVEAVEQAGLSDRTIFVVTSDHGESLGENDYFDHGYLFDSNLIVPLVIFDPRQASASERIDAQVRQIDLLPTLLDLAKLPPASDADGVSLVPLIRGESTSPSGVAWSYAPETNHGLGIRTDRLKFILRDSLFPASRGRDWEAYALRDDPQEGRPLDDSSSAAIRSARTAAWSELSRARATYLLDWVNSGDSDLTGSLRLSSQSSRNLKWVESGGATFRLERDGELAFSIPGRSRSVIRMQSPVASVEFRLQVREGGRSIESRGTLLLRDLCERRTDLLDSGPGSASRLELTARALVGCDSSSIQMDDRDLLSRLHALGYLK